MKSTILFHYREELIKLSGNVSTPQRTIAMSKIKTLIQGRGHMYQEIADLKNNWRNQKWATGPVNRDEAEKALREIYQFYGKEVPPIVWYQSPFEAIQVNFLLAQVYEDISEFFSNSPVKRLTSKLRNTVYEEIEKQEDWGLLITRMVHRIKGNLRRQVWVPVQNEAIHHQVGDFVDDCILDELNSKLDLLLNLKALEWDQQKYWFLWNNIRCRSFDTKESLSLMTYGLFSQLCDFSRSSILEWALALAQNTSLFFPFKKIAILVEKPIHILMDEQERLHDESRPAILWSNLRGIYQWHGTRVPQEVIERSHNITSYQIDRETDPSVRRVMLERFGLERYLIESNPKMVHQDEYGVLFTKELTNDEPLTMVKVFNATPEKDGTYKSFYIRVPDTMRTAKQAVAWTFQLREEDFYPLIET